MDLAILAPPTDTIPARIHARANGMTPVAASASAASQAWCGKARSPPPQWMSTLGPNSASTIAAHSACHPGRPSPHGLGQLTSSSGPLACHTMVSSGSSLSGSSGRSWNSAARASAVSRSTPACAAACDVRA